MPKFIFLLVFLVGCSNTPSTSKKYEPPHDVCDYCNYGFNLTIRVNDSEDLIVKPGETAIFKIDLTKDSFAKSGGWFWHCGRSPERTQILNAKAVKVTRDNRGNVYWLAIPEGEKHE